MKIEKLSKHEFKKEVHNLAQCNVLNVLPRELKNKKKSVFSMMSAVADVVATKSYSSWFLWHQFRKSPFYFRKPNSQYI